MMDDRKNGGIDVTSEPPLQNDIPDTASSSRSSGDPVVTVAEAEGEVFNVTAPPPPQEDRKNGGIDVTSDPPLKNDTPDTASSSRSSGDPVVTVAEAEGEVFNVTAPPPPQEDRKNGGIDVTSDPPFRFEDANAWDSLVTSKPFADFYII